MEYVLPKDLSHKFDISIQTVYNYLTKHEGNIRIRKEYWKTFINLEDFTTFLQPSLKTFESREETPQSDANSQEMENLKKNFSKLENEHELVVQRSEDLEKYNVNLQEQLTRYGLMLTEEKAEKREILNKYESVQKEFHEKVETIQKESNEKVESLYREKSLFEKRYFLLLGFVILLIVFIARTVLSPLLGLR